MGGYTKLFNGILHSTVWQEDYPTKILWITMLAMTDQDGIVSATVPGLARAAGITLEECDKALERFQSPDKYSRTKTDEGRRIREIDGGWEIINHAKYRDLMSDEDRQEKARIRQQKWRERHKRQDVTPERDNVTPERYEALRVTPCHANNDIQIQKQKQKQKQIAKEEEKAEERERQKPEPPSLALVSSYFTEIKSQLDPERFFDHYETIGWIKSGSPIVDWKACARKWQTSEFAALEVANVVAAENEIKYQRWKEQGFPGVPSLSANRDGNDPGKVTDEDIPF